MGDKSKEKDDFGDSPQITNKSTKRSVKKVLAEWDDESILKLISAVEMHECLWNAGVKEYRNKSHRDDAWKDVFNNFGEKYTVDELSAKWANLRIQFKSYAAKFRKTKSGQGTGENQVHWRFFKSMLFIEAAERDQSTYSESNLVSKIWILFNF